MHKTAKILFLIFGVIIPIFIGSLHIYVHFKDLLTPEIYEYLQKEVFISYKNQALWNSWGIMSFMMGSSFITIGLINLAIFLKFSKAGHIPKMVISSMMFYQFCVIYVGYTFDQAFQFYGGIVGFIAMKMCLILIVFSTKTI